MSPKNEIRVAIITGGSSGIGAALANHLLSKPFPRWYIVQADIQSPHSANLPSDRTKYIRTDVTDWSSQAACFKEAFDWHQRLDFAALNAGIDDRDDIFSSIGVGSLGDGPRKPNMATFEVDLLGVYYGIKLAAHYLSASDTSVKQATGNARKGNIVLTASQAGLYPSGMFPMYSACKAALISFTRSLAPAAIRSGIGLNAICPGPVRTAFHAPGLIDSLPEEMATPMSTVLRAYDEIMEEGQRKTGGVVEISGDKIFWRENDGWRRHPDDAVNLTGSELRKRRDAYLERNRKWVVVDAEKEKGRKRLGPSL